MTDSFIYIILAILVIIIVGLAYYLFNSKKSNELINCSTFLGNLDWRRSVKHFSPGSVDYKSIIRAIQNAPSSFGMQPYKVIILTNKQLKMDISPFCFDQPQITECDVLLVFCAIKRVEERMEEYLKITGNEPMRGMMTEFIQNLPDKVEWSRKQAYIALGFALAAATELKIASCPIEGFIPDKVAEILATDPNYIPSVFLAIGREKKTDVLAPKFRFSEENLFHLED